MLKNINVLFDRCDFLCNLKNRLAHYPMELSKILIQYMAYKALDKYIEIPEQQLNTFNRSGFTVVEWGGTEVK